jgi:hypothetical protein
MEGKEPDSYKRATSCSAAVAVARVQRGEDAFAPQLSFDKFGLLGKVAPAPDGALTNIGLLVFLQNGPVRIGFVFKAGVAGTKARVATVDFEIVGADWDRHERILAWRKAGICYISLSHAAKFSASN